MAAKRVGAGAVIFDEQGRVLLVKHNYGPLNWEIPGGGAEPNETPVETALREVWEETSLRVVAAHMTGVYYVEENDAIGFVFFCHRTDKEAEPFPQAAEITECGYWFPDALPRPISDWTIRRIQDAVSGVALPLPVTIPLLRILP